MGVDIEDVKRIVVEAGQLARLYYGKVTRSIKADLSVVTEADDALEHFFRLSLTALAPRYGYIGEETDEVREPAPGEEHAWVVDALDGSRAFCDDEPLQPAYSAALTPNTFILGPTNHQRTFAIDFPGRIYFLGAPIYQLCLTAKGAVAAMFFDPAVNLWDLALPSVLLERAGAVLVYASGRPVDLAELIDRRKIAEPIFAGGAEIV